MSNKAKVPSPLTPSPTNLLTNDRIQVSSTGLNAIIFKSAASSPLPTRLLSLFPGLGYAAGYKISQRIYKFGGQPLFNDLLKKNYKDNFTNVFGERNGKLMMQATAGRYIPLLPSPTPPSLSFFLASAKLRVRVIETDRMCSLTGIGEVVLLPLDVLKIKMQTNPEAFRGRGLFRIVAEEGSALYRGWGWTMARNAPGSFAVRPIPPSSSPVPHSPSLPL